MARREEIIGLLSKEPHSAQQLANYYKVELPEILEDLEHIKFSIRPRKLEMIPAQCKSCGFLFKERSRIKKPSKCPRCKNERIMAPLFTIK